MFLILTKHHVVNPTSEASMPIQLNLVSEILHTGGIKNHIALHIIKIKRFDFRSVVQGAPASFKPDTDKPFSYPHGHSGGNPFINYIFSVIFHLLFFSLLGSLP